MARVDDQAINTIIAGFSLLLVTTPVTLVSMNILVHILP